MSYILDALKRAQSERELGQVPAMQGALRESSGAESAAGTSNGTWRWATGALLLLLAAGAWAVWWALQRKPETAAITAAPTAGTPLASPVITPDPRRPTASSDASAVTAAPPVLPPVLPAAPPAPPTITPPAATAAPDTGTAPLAPNEAARAPSVPGRPATQGNAPASSANLPVVALESLDAPTRARLPRLSIGGTIHANERAQRMVILDGQVLREGEAVLPGLTVDTIDTQGVLLRLDERFGPPRRVRLSP